MYLKVLLIFIVFIGGLACKQKSKPAKQLEILRDKNLGIVIEFAQSSKIDVTANRFTVFNIERPQFDTQFHLLSTEKNQIIEKYYSLSLYDLNDIDISSKLVYIKDNCMDMPKLYTTLTFNSNQNIQRIQIDASCHEYSRQDKTKASRVKEFIDFVANIIMKKPEVSNAPPSDIIYY